MPHLQPTGLLLPGRREVGSRNFAIVQQKSVKTRLPSPGRCGPVPIRPALLENALSLTLADLCCVGERVFNAPPNMARNFYTVWAWPGHARNLMVPNFAAYCRDGIAEGQN